VAEAIEAVLLLLLLLLLSPLYRRRS